MTALSRMTSLHRVSTLYHSFTLSNRIVYLNMHSSTALMETSFPAGSHKLHHFIGAYALHVPHITALVRAMHLSRTNNS
jgi:hypothetical protein